MTAQPRPLHPLNVPRLTFALVLVATLGILWSYWTTLGEIVWRWSHDAQYSHGYLVPAFALYVLWQRRATLTKLKPSAWGLAILGGAAALRLAGTFFHFGYIDQISLLPSLLGLFLLGGGWAAFAWCWPAVGFLAFMVPLPHTFSLALAGPMQTFATNVSTFGLQVLGRPAIAEGNVILLNDIELGIVEACSGLRMLVVFFALSTAVAMLIRKPLWEKLVIAGSAIPIALAANVLRITVTGLFYDSFGNGFGGHFFHDLAGWLMMPLGLAFLGIELWILGRLLIDPPARLGPQVTMQRVEVSPLSLYGRATASRRERRAARAAEPAPQQPVPQS